MLFGSLAFNLIKPKASLQSPFFLLSLFNAILISGLIFVLLLSSLRLEDPLSDRFLMPFYFFPLCFLPLFLVVFKNLLADKWFKTGLASLLVISVLILNINAASSFVYKSKYYPPYVQCLDEFIKETGAGAGITHYGLSKKLSMISQSGIKLINVGNKLRQRFWIGTRSWKYDEYDLVVFDKKYKRVPAEYLNQIKKVKGVVHSQKQSCGKGGRYQAYFFEDGFSI